MRTQRLFPILHHFNGILIVAAAFLVIGRVEAKDSVFSGPQPGERATSFKLLDLNGAEPGRERDPMAENTSAPTALVFIHAIERSLVPLLQVIDQYGLERKDRIKTEVVFLFADRLEGEQRAKAVLGSLRLGARAGLSLDGLEGPGNYGLNKDCMMTILALRDQRVVANFALVQPGIADAPKVIEALARACGDAEPPSVASLQEKKAGRAGMARANAMPSDRMAANAGVPTETPKDPFPGAVPTDGRLQGLLRQFIRPANDDAVVDKTLTEVKAYIQGDADLTRQAIDGWTRVLHFGDRYGTEYSRKVGREFLQALKSTPAQR